MVWQAHTDTVLALAFSSDERRLASGSWDGENDATASSSTECKEGMRGL
ncbi:MAG: WD40 repeat domain-containing protein [Ktedonobacteraceae bacterium]